MLTVADRGRGGVKFAKILLTSYVNAPILSGHAGDSFAAFLNEVIL